MKFTKEKELLELLKREDLDLSGRGLHDLLIALVDYVDTNGFDNLSDELIENLIKQDMLGVNEGLGISCAMDGNDAFIEARVAEFDNRWCLMCVDCFKEKNTHLGWGYGKLLVDIDSGKYELISNLIRRR